MATYPYTPSVKSISDALAAFRKTLPPAIDSDTLKKLGIAPNNESALISILQFLALVADDSKPAAPAKDIFYLSNDDFEAGFSKLVKQSYIELFNLYGDDTWNLSQDKLVGFFRQSDKTSEITGQRQANTFIALADLAGLRTISPPAKVAKQAKPNNKPSAPKGKPAPAAKIVEPAVHHVALPAHQNGGLALSVRVEVNLPATADQAVYDSIFKSIRDNLLKPNA